MLKFYSANYLFPINSAPIRRGVVAVDANGVINAVYSADEALALGDIEIERFSGVIIPGFVNTHCHLELSHMKGEIERQTGLIDFIKNVIKKRQVDEEEIVLAMVQADNIMFENGIQAVGDHVNSAISAKVKQNSKMHYHTFVEIIGLNEDQAEEKIDEAKEIEFFFGSKNASITPHAPYSVSKSLFKALKKLMPEDNILSVHSQESEEENRLFRYKEGQFLELYDFLGFDYSSVKAQARNSLQSYVPYLPSKNRLILVHNTYASIKDIDFLNRIGRKVVFCLCPKANLYIEGNLPKLNFFDLDGDNLTLGTDSLASNDTLDILEEIKVLHQHYPELDLKKSLKWATLNGAKALGLESNLGSIEVGKRPGLVLLKGLKDFNLTEDVRVQRLI